MDLCRFAHPAAAGLVIEARDGIDSVAGSGSCDRSTSTLAGRPWGQVSPLNFRRPTPILMVEDAVQPATIRAIDGGEDQRLAAEHRPRQAAWHSVERWTKSPQHAQGRPERRG